MYRDHIYTDKCLIDLNIKENGTRSIQAIKKILDKKTLKE